jgi:tetratricopeptide (TPR) repeat protein
VTLVTVAICVLFAYCLALILALFGLILFPLLTILDCANSVREKTPKALWIIFMFFLGPIGAISYGLFGTQRTLYRKFSYFCVAVFAPALLLAFIDKNSALSLLMQLPLRNHSSRATASLGKAAGGTAIQGSLKCMDGIPKYTIHKKYEEAIQDFTAGINMAPDDGLLANCYVMRGESFQALGRSENAEKDYQKAIALAQKSLQADPKDGGALLTLSDVNKAKKNYAEAIRYVEQAMKLDPKKYAYREWGLKELQRLNTE